jgi:hypothetical protein
LITSFSKNNDLKFIVVDSSPVEPKLDYKNVELIHVLSDT